MSVPHDSTAQFITAMKLRELNRQRTKLRETYRELAETSAALQRPEIKLKTLYAGLRQISFAGQPLHPDVVNLELLFFEDDSGTLSPDVRAMWVRRLEEELATGRLRSEFVYLFGALLEEWARSGPADSLLLEEGKAAKSSLLRAAVSSPGPNRHREVIDPLMKGFGQAMAELGERLRKASQERLRGPVTAAELSIALHHIGDNIYQPAALRREARRFANSKSLEHELTDALTILITELHTWDWPPEGLATRALWTRNKWRLYLDEGLPTASLLEVVGSRWVAVLGRLIGDPTMVINRKARLKKLVELRAPSVILDNERRMLGEAEQMLALNTGGEDEVWEKRGETTGAEATGNGITRLRGNQQGALRAGGLETGYGDEYGADINGAVVLVNAEIQLARAAYPQLPVYLVKVDLQDYYASIPHDVLLTILRSLGAEDADIVFIGRLLAPSLLGPDPSGRGGPEKAVPMAKGIPMSHALPALLAELLMRLLELHVTRHVRVRIVRLIDDICLLTPDPAEALAGWNHIEEFCTACGLRINQAKCGAICIGGELPPSLPTQRPRWGMLELDENGQWQVHEETFQAHVTQACNRVNAAGSVFSRSQLYNANAKFLLASLSLGAALGDEHRHAVGSAVRRFHRDFFGPGRGIIAGLSSDIRARFQPEASDIPEAWIYWPITAGGLGLTNPLITAGQYAEAYSAREKVSAPTTREPGWDSQANQWSKYYEHLLTPVSPVEPKETKVMKTLVDDFIQRGSKISDGKQTGLTPYWRWVLYTYGPQILQRFGTFRFLITELVPLQLISQQRVQETSLDNLDTTTHT